MGQQESGDRIQRRPAYGRVNAVGDHLHWGMKVTGHTYDAHNGDEYAADLSPIPGVYESYNPDRVCGTP